MGATVYPTTLDTDKSLPEIRSLGRNAAEGAGTSYMLQQMKAAVIQLEINAGLSGAGLPKSGTSGTGAGGVVSRYYDTVGKMMYANTGSVASPYWEPLGLPGSGNTIGVYEDFRDPTGIPVAGNSADAYLPSGARIFGDGSAETADSGVVVTKPSGEGGRAKGVFTTTNEDLHVIAIGAASQSYQPDQHGGAIIDVELSNVSAITNRSMFIGFAGTAIDAMLTPMTISSTTITNVLTDMFGLGFDTDGGNGDGLYATHNAANGDATIDYTSETESELSTNIAAAGTFQRFRAEVDEDGGGRLFINKVLVYTLAAAGLDVDEELSPLAMLMSGAISIASMDVRTYFHIWNRSTS